MTLEPWRRPTPRQALRSLADYLDDPLLKRPLRRHRIRRRRRR
ncbi:MAG: hypothetical protein ACE5JG_06945 [Planctomycetota bacterium]